MDSGAGRALFLSYAREDTDAARRVADALRAFGLEVWFDQSELRGGDAWDARIRKQIRECALFVPIISAQSQARHEGYFRREWKLAVERTHDMAAGVAFIVPVVVDETTEAEALVPEEFLRYQWTHLPHGVPTPEFVAQVKRLVESPRRPGARGQKSEVRSQRSENRSQTSEVPRAAKRSRLPGWIWGVLVIFAAGIGVAVFSTRKSTPAPGSPTAAASSLTPSSLNPSRPAAPDAKSIAVMPFENISADRGNAYFCDGVQEDVLTNLTNIRELHVISRTSVEPYRHTTKPIAQIARELHVAWIVEGSVQREGNQVRVACQLINPRTDENVWAQAYDRKVNDIFAIQSQIAQAIAGALQARISPAEQSVLNRKPTANPAAYDLFLQARQLQNRATTDETKKQIQLLQSAVQLDPGFAEAWAELADVCAFAHFSFSEGSEALLTRARAAIDRATRLAPNDPTVIEDLGTYYYYGFRDYTRAAEQYGRLAQLQPNDPSVYNSLGLILRRQGQWAESLADSRRAVQLDPANLQYLRNLETTLIAGRRWDEAMVIQRRINALLPNDLMVRIRLAVLAFEATGSTREGKEFFAGLSPKQRDSPLGVYMRKRWATQTGDFAEAIRLDHRQPYFDGLGIPRWRQALVAASAYLGAGDRAGAIARLGNYPAELHRRLEREPGNPVYWAFLSGMEAILGHRDEARKDAGRAVELLPESRDAIAGVGLATQQAVIFDWTGAKNRALADYTRLLQVPEGPNVHDLKLGYSSLRGDPRFEALLADPKNNAPLF